MSAAQNLVSIERPGDVLSPSQTSGFLSCSAAWAFKYILKLPDPPTGSRTQGSAIHEALGANFAEKIETKKDLPAAGVQAIYRKAWDDLVAGNVPSRHGKPALPTEFRIDEDPDTLKAQGEALTLKYLDEAAPSIEPAAVELPVVGRIGDVLTRGYIDLLDVNGRVIDIKSAAKTPSDITPQYRFQVATYSQLLPQSNGTARVDTLVKNKTPKLVQQEFTVDQADIAQTQIMYPRVQQAIRSGLVLPNRAHFMCGRNQCSYWRACEREFGGRVS